MAKLSRGFTGRKHTAETRAKMSAAHLGNTVMVGRKLSEETRAKMSAARKKHLESHPGPNAGKTWDDAYKAKMAEALRKHHQEHLETREKISKASIGHEVTAETRAKISAGNRGKVKGPPTEEHKAKLSAATMGRKLSEKELAQRIGRKHREETKVKIAAGNIPTAIANSKRLETASERLLYSALKQLGIDFEPHHLILNRYVADVFLPAYNIVLEAEGKIHLLPKVKAHDEIRFKAIREAGFKLVRLSNTQIKADPIVAVGYALKHTGD